MPLVFFHGWGFSHTIWLSLAQALEKDYELYLVDLPGYGKSVSLDWESFKTELLHQLPEAFAIAGWSLGGLFASRLTIEEPSHITHLVNIASSPCFIRERDWPGVDKQVFAEFCSNLVAEPLETLMKFVGLQLNGQSLQKKHLSLPSALSLQEGLKILAEWDLREALGRIMKPTCFMFGRLDTITTRRTMAAMQARYPQFRYILFSKAAHMPFLAEQEMFITCLREFVQ